MRNKMRIRSLYKKIIIFQKEYTKLIFFWKSKINNKEAQKEELFYFAFGNKSDFIDILLANHLMIFVYFKSIIQYKNMIYV